MTRLERRCRRLALAHPDAVRREELVTTLLETSAARRAPRLGDAVDVLWHGLVARLGNRDGGTRFGAWGDALAVAVVLAAVVQAATSVAVAHRALELIGGEYPGPWIAHRGPWSDVPFLVQPFFRGPGEAYAAVAAMAGTVATAAAMALGKVRTARVLTALALAGGIGTYGWARATGTHLPFTTNVGYLVAGVGVLVAGVVLGTGVVARAARVVPRWWWGLTALVATATAIGTVEAAPPQALGWGRAGVLLTAYAITALVVALLALPLARSFPDVCGGAIALAAVTMPVAVVLFQDIVTNRQLDQVLGYLAIAWAVTAALAALLLRRRRTPA